MKKIVVRIAIFCCFFILTFSALSYGRFFKKDMRLSGGTAQISFAVEKERKKGMFARLPLARETKKEIEIDLSEQKLRTWQDGKVLGEYGVSSGKTSTPTRVGDFSVLSKLPMAHGCGQGQCWDMPYWLGVYLVGGAENGIHELPFINGRREGQGSIGWPVSHGCVRLPIGPAELVYSWADIGISVKIHK